MDHVTREQLDRLRAGTLSPAEVAAVGAHAATCTACGKAVAESFSLDRRLRDLRIRTAAEDEVEHLSSDVLMELADGSPEDVDALAHLEECDVCRGEVDELRALKASLRRPRRTWIPYAVAASIAAIAISVARLNRAPEPPPVRVPAVTVTRPVRVPQPQPPRYSRPDWERDVARAETTRALPVPSVIEGLRASTTTLRGADSGDDLRLDPNGRVVSSPRPRFQWAAREGATYRVILLTGERVIESEPRTTPAWQPPFDLERGAEYRWQVEVTIDGARRLFPRPSAAPPRFVVLERRAADEIAEARRQHPDDALLHAVILARYGLRDEALQSVTLLEKKDPALAGALRESIEAWPR